VRRALLLVSFLLFPVTFYYLSPYLIIMGAGERTASGSMVVFGVMTLTALVLGRLFCGWVCPAGGLGEALFGCRTGRRTTGETGRGGLSGSRGWPSSSW
jgi:polyferredoxin